MPELPVQSHVCDTGDSGQSMASGARLTLTYPCRVPEIFGDQCVESWEFLKRRLAPLEAKWFGTQRTRRPVSYVSVLLFSNSVENYSQ